MQAFLVDFIILKRSSIMRRILLIIIMLSAMLSISACGVLEDPTEAEIKNTIPTYLLNYNLNNIADTATLESMNIIEIKDKDKDTKSCIVRCELVLNGRYIKRTIYADFSCELYDKSGWEITGLSEYKKEIIVINEIPDNLYSMSYYGYEDKTTYDNNTFDIIYYTSEQYSFAKMNESIELSGNIYRSDNEKTTDKYEYTIDYSVNRLNDKSYDIDYDSILGTWAEDGYDAWAIDIIEITDEKIKWVAQRYSGYEDNITTGNYEGYCFGENNWWVDESSETLNMDFHIAYDYEYSFFGTGNRLGNRDYDASFCVPITSIDEKVYIKYTGYDGGQYCSELWRYDDYDLDYLYFHNSDVSLNGKSNKEDSDDKSSALDYYYDFPDWYEMDKAVVYDNMICMARSDAWYWYDEAIPYLSLYVFDESGYIMDIFSWLCFSDEKLALKVKDDIDNSPDSENYYYDKDIITFHNNTESTLQEFASIYGKNSFYDITKQDVIDNFSDWLEIVYK